MLESGKNPTLRYLGRTHRVDLAWLFERFKECAYDLKYCTSEEQCADIFTKPFTLKEKWQQATRLIGHMTYEELFDPNMPAIRPPTKSKPVGKAKAKAKSISGPSGVATTVQCSASEPDSTDTDTDTDLFHLPVPVGSNRDLLSCHCPES